MALNGKAIVVTGAGRGIGAAAARHLAASGARVVINDIDEAPAREIAALIAADGGVAVPHTADITDWNAAAGLVDRCLAEFGAVDGLVNNAGLFALGRIDEVQQGDAERLLAANVTGTVHCTVHAAKVMGKQRRGAIVNVTSGAQMGMPAMGLYGATKGAVASLTYAWALELAAFGIHVNAVSPMAKTRMVDTTAAYYRAHGMENAPTAEVHPAANAPVIAYLLSDAACALNGQIVRIDGERLSLTSHPAVLLPTLHRAGGWTLEALAEAFDRRLAAQLAPLGFTGVEVAGYAMPGGL